MNATIETTAAQTVEKLTTEEHVALLKEKLKQGLAAIQTGDDWKRHLKTMTKVGPFSPLRFSFNNQVLLFVQGEERAEADAAVDLSAVATFDAWKRSGRLVRKGEKALWVLRPNLCKNTKALESARDEARGSGKSLSPDDEKRFSFIRYSLMAVFAVSQTEGEALPVAAVPNVETSDGWALSITALCKVAKAEGVPSIVFRARQLLDGPGSGWCKNAERSITVITDGQSHAEQFATAVHELAHAILHCGQGAIDRHAYPQNEVEAESIAFIVCGAMNLDTKPESFSYVRGWAGADPVKQVEASGRRIAQTACKIIDALAGIERGRDGE